MIQVLVFIGEKIISNDLLENIYSASGSIESSLHPSYHFMINIIFVYLKIPITKLLLR